MPSSFSFGFDDDDIDQDTFGGKVLEGKTHADEEEDSVPIPPRIHSYLDLVSTLPSHLSYTFTSLEGLDGRPILLPRRDLHDIRAQLMAEDSLTNPSQFPIPGLAIDDINPNIYEGGFKTWECAVDLATYLLHRSQLGSILSNENMRVIELGAGTALPALVLLDQWLGNQGAPNTNSQKHLHLTLADYNESVLGLTTIPNLLLTCMDRRTPVDKSEEIEIDASTVAKLDSILRSNNITVSAISGGWSPKFSALVSSDFIVTASYDTLILASETIYSPDSILHFSTTLMELLSAAQKNGQRAKALVAAKQVYFGVGGGVNEFKAALTGFGARAQTVWQSEGLGVRRLVLEITRT